MRAFITGIEGFAGHYLAGELFSNGWQVAGSYLDKTSTEGLPQVALFPIDLARGDGLGSALEQFGPDIVFHLAAQSSAALSFKKPELTFEVNVLGTVCLLQEICRMPRKPRLVLISSCEVYGSNPDDRPLAEDRGYNPHSPYAASKAAQEMVGVSYLHSYDLDLVIARPFPHVGPGQSENFALPSFAKQIAEIESSRQEPKVRVGNLEARRDFTDVRDVVRAYRLLAERGRQGQAYNICSGRAVSMREALDFLLSQAKVPIEIEPDPNRLRPSDTPLLLGDNRKIREETGWRPQYDIGESLSNLLGHWRQRLSS